MMTSVREFFSGGTWHRRILWMWKECWRERGSRHVFQQLNRIFARASASEEISPNSSECWCKETILAPTLRSCCGPGSYLKLSKLQLCTSFSYHFAISGIKRGIMTSSILSSMNNKWRDGRHKQFVGTRGLLNTAPGVGSDQWSCPCTTGLSISSFYFVFVGKSLVRVPNPLGPGIEAGNLSSKSFAPVPFYPDVTSFSLSSAALWWRAPS